MHGVSRKLLRGAPAAAGSAEDTRPCTDRSEKEQCGWHGWGACSGDAGRAAPHQSHHKAHGV